MSGTAVPAQQSACVVPAEFRMGYYWNKYEGWDPKSYYTDLDSDYWSKWESYDWSDWDYSDFNWDEYDWSDLQWSDYYYDSLGTDTDSLGTDTDSLGTDTDSLGTDTDSLGTDTDSLGAGSDSARMSNARNRERAQLLARRRRSLLAQRGAGTDILGMRQGGRYREEEGRSMTERELARSDYSDSVYSDSDYVQSDYSDQFVDYYFEVSDPYSYYAYYMDYLTEGLEDGEMIGATTGNCGTVLQAGKECKASCPAGHKPGNPLKCQKVEVSGVSKWAVNQTGVCVERSCDASEPPLGGTRGNCTSLLPSGSHCVPSCPKGDTVVGQTICSLGVLVQKAICYNTYDQLRADQEFDKLAPLADVSESGKVVAAAASTFIASSIGSSVAGSIVSSVSSTMAAGISSAMSSVGLSTGGIGLVALMGSVQEFSLSSHLGSAVPDAFAEISNSLSWANLRIMPPNAPKERPPKPEEKPVVVDVKNATKPQRKAENVTATGRNMSASVAPGAAPSPPTSGGRVLLAVGDQASNLPGPTGSALGYWGCENRFEDVQGFQMCEVWAQMIGLGIALLITAVGHVALYFGHKSARRALWNEQLAATEAQGFAARETENSDNSSSFRDVMRFKMVTRKWRAKAKVRDEDRSWTTAALMLLGGDPMAAIVLPPNLEIMTLTLLTPGLAESSGAAIGTGTDAGLTVGIVVFTFLCAFHLLLSELLLIQLYTVMEFDEFSDAWRPVRNDEEGETSPPSAEAATDSSTNLAARISLTGWYHYRPGSGIRGLVLQTWTLIITCFIIGFFYSACAGAQQDDASYSFEAGCGTIQIAVVVSLGLFMLCYKWMYKPLLDPLQAQASFYAQASRLIALCCLIASMQSDEGRKELLAGLFVLFSTLAVMVQVFAEGWKFYRSLNPIKAGVKNPAQVAPEETGETGATAP